MGRSRSRSPAHRSHREHRSRREGERRDGWERGRRSRSPDLRRRSRSRDDQRRGSGSRRESSPERWRSSRRRSPSREDQRRDGRGGEERNRRGAASDRDGASAGASTSAPVADASGALEEAKKAARLAKLAAWRAEKRIGGATEAPNVLAAPRPQADEADPLDAFMAHHVDPEVASLAAQDAARVAAERAALAEEMARAGAGGALPRSLASILEEEEEERPDMELVVPTHKMKLVVGPGGETIRAIQKRTKCRIQHRKTEAAMEAGFGTSSLAQLGAERAAAAAARGQGREQAPTTTLQLFGNAQQCEAARALILEAVDNRVQKDKQRAKEYEKKKDVRCGRGRRARGGAAGLEGSIRYRCRMHACIWHIPRLSFLLKTRADHLSRTDGFSSRCRRPSACSARSTTCDTPRTTRRWRCRWGLPRQTSRSPTASWRSGGIPTKIQPVARRRRRSSRKYREPTTRS